jgi:UDP-glucose 4-epimerase
MANIIVTGASGFIGGHMASLLHGEHNLIGLGRRPSPVIPGGWRYEAVQPGSPAFLELLERFRPDYLLHCAGIGAVGRTMEFPAEDFAAGPALTFALMEALRQKAPGCVTVYFSSAAVHGNPARQPIGLSTPTLPISPYGFHKAMCETILQEFKAVYGLDAIVLRIFSCYGPGLRKQIFWDICRKAVQGRVELFGTGEETRDFIHVRDLGRLAGLLVSQGRRSGVFPVGAGRSVSISHLARLLVASLGEPPVAVAFRGDEHNGYPKHWLCDMAACAGLGFTPEIPLEGGAAEYAEWFLASGAAQAANGGAL